MWSIQGLLHKSEALNEFKWKLHLQFKQEKMRMLEGKKKKKKKEMRNCLNKGWGIWWEIGMTFLDPVRAICHNYTHIYMLVHQSICLYTTKIKPTRNDEK